MSGLRLVVAQAVEDEPICRIEPVRSHSCSETKTIRLEIDQLRGLQDYVDAQEGGPRSTAGCGSSRARARRAG